MLQGIGYTVCELVKMFTSLVWNNLGTILELRKIASYFTPAGMIAVYLGVPVAAVSVTIFIIKKLIKS